MAGFHANITSTHNPKQGINLGKRVECHFQHGNSNIVGGVVMRDDIEESLRTIIRLDDGRFLLGSECQFRPCA